MPNSFSAFFVSKLNASVVNSVTYTLIVGSLDCTNEMQALPRIKRETDQVVTENTNFKFVRSDALVNSLSVQSFSWFNQPVAFSWGFKTDSGTDDTIQLMAGRVSKMAIAKDVIEMGVVDRNDIFSRISVGSKDNPNGYTARPSTQWWNLVTVHGGLSGVASSSNPDIDYDAWKAWSDDDTSDGRLWFRRSSEGTKVLDLQQKVIDLSISAVFQDGTGRLVPIYWAKRIVSGSMEISDSEIIGDIETSFQDDQMNNRAMVEWYDFFTSDVDHVSYQNSDSVNSWGLHEVEIGTDDDMKVYDVSLPSSLTTGAASLTAIRKVIIADDPWELVRYRLKTNISGMKYLPEDAVTLVTSRDLVESRDLTVRKVEYDLDKGLVDIVMIGRSG